MEQILKNFTFDFFGQGKHKISFDKLMQMDSAILLDVRSRQEVKSISINMECFTNIKCKNIPVDELPDRIDEFSKEDLIATFCPANVRSSIAYAYLWHNGFSFIKILEGGYAGITDAIKPGMLYNIRKKEETNYFLWSLVKVRSNFYLLFFLCILFLLKQINWSWFHICLLNSICKFKGNKNSVF